MYCKYYCTVCPMSLPTFFMYSSIYSTSFDESNRQCKYLAVKYGVCVRSSVRVTVEKQVKD